MHNFILTKKNDIDIISSHCTKLKILSLFSLLVFNTCGIWRIPNMCFHSHHHIFSYKYLFSLRYQSTPFLYITWWQPYKLQTEKWDELQRYAPISRDPNNEDWSNNSVHSTNRWFPSTTCCHVLYVEIETNTVKPCKSCQPALDLSGVHLKLWSPSGNSFSRKRKNS